jgi:hypothetical protein
MLRVAAWQLPWWLWPRCRTGMPIMPSSIPPCAIQVRRLHHVVFRFRRLRARSVQNAVSRLTSTQYVAGTEFPRWLIFLTYSPIPAKHRRECRAIATRSLFAKRTKTSAPGRKRGRVFPSREGSRGPLGGRQGLSTAGRSGRHEWLDGRWGAGRPTRSGKASRKRQGQS